MARHILNVIEEFIKAPILSRYDIEVYNNLMDELMNSRVLLDHTDEISKRLTAYNIVDKQRLPIVFSQGFIAGMQFKDYLDLQEQNKDAQQG